jgi:hypothetical protein
MYARDWIDTFLPAVIALFNGGNVYATIYNPPWVLFPLIPFALLPYGRVLMLAVAIVALGMVAYRLRVKPVVMALFVLSPVVYNALAWGNIEWLTLLGLVSVPPISFLLLMLKPQMTICVIAFLLVELWRKGQRKTLAVSLGTMVGALVLSVMFFGLWFLRLGEYTTFTDSVVNMSFFPYSIPLGVALFVTSLKTRKIQFALAASPMFFAVVTPPVWVVAVLAVSSLPLVALGSFVTTWGATLYLKRLF